MNRTLVAFCLSLAFAACPQQDKTPPPPTTTTKTPEPVAAPPKAEPAHASFKDEAKPNRFWWPKQLNLQPLRDHAPGSNPMGDDFDYRAAFAKVDVKALKAEIKAIMTDSQDWWPADYGHYGPLFVRMAWHRAGTYRLADGRGGAGGGQQRFEPLNSWPDNGNLDKARRLLWPIKKKYGASVSWADLMVLTGNVAMESMGFKTFGFAGGREDDWEADLVYWGPETEMLGSDRFHGSKKEAGRKAGDLKSPLAAVRMGLIYVNPEGPGGVPDPLASAKEIRETFGRMAMNDEETVALIAGGHTFGKAHGAHKAKDCVGPAPAAEGVVAQGFGWKNKCGTGVGKDAVTSGLEGAWTSTPTQWTTQYLSNLMTFEWKQTKSPGGGIQFIPKNPEAQKLVPDAHDKNKRHPPVMFTTDLALKKDPAYRKVVEKFLKDPKNFELAFAKAWFKLTHRDMGPRANYVGDDVPSEVLTWQDPVPAGNLPSAATVATLKKKIASSDLSVQQLVSAAWASASSYRGSDMRGGANGARVRLAPQKDWAANDPAQLQKTLKTLDELRGKSKISMADMIVLGGAVGIEKAAGNKIKVPFKGGRGDAEQAQTDVNSFSFLEPEADGFRNFTKGDVKSPAQALVSKADQLTLTVPEMTVLVGGLRALDVNTGGKKHGVFTETPGKLTNDFFVNLLDMSTKWSPSGGIFEGVDRKTGANKWTATEVDLVFGSNAELRAVVEVYAFDGAQKKFMADFVNAWVKVMNLDR